MKEDKNICLSLIGNIINKNLTKITFLNTQQTLTSGIDTRSIRLDALVEDKDGNIYDVEMQTGNFKQLPMRFRGYQAVIDSNNWKRGDNFDKLKETYIIFLCTNDPFGKNLPVYTFYHTCNECSSFQLDTKMHWIVLNAKAYQNAPVKIYSLLEYMETGQLSYDSDPLTEEIHTAVCSINNDRERISTMTTVADKINEIKNEKDAIIAKKDEEIKKLKKQLAKKK